MIKKFIIFIIGSLFLLILWMSWSMIEFKSKQLNIHPIKKVEINENRSIKNLSEAITYRTISEEDSNNFDAVTFLAFQNFLERTYPLTFKILNKKVYSGYSILLKWEGYNTTLQNPILLMAHMDVVPAEEIDKWEEDPFSGLIKDNFIWGRGSIDDKSSLISILESVEYLINQGFRPERDIYISIGHDEENSGTNGNVVIAQSLKDQGLYFDLVLDEGSIISDRIIQGVDYPVAIIGIAEKGYLSMKLTSHSKSGHSSIPESQTTIGKLSKAIYNLERNQMPSDIIAPINDFFSYLGPEMSIKNRFILSNYKLLSSSIINNFEKSAVTNSMIRTTIAPTIISGGNKSNVLPSEATAIVNFRIRQGDTINKVKQFVINTVNDSDIIIETLSGSFFSEPSKVSNSNSPSFNAIHKTIKEIFNDVIVVPGLTLAATDSRHYQSISKDIYRFMPLQLNTHNLSMIHGYNEKISISAYFNMIQFYIQLIKNVHVL